MKTWQEMERVVTFVRESCERDALPEWLTREVVERFKFEFLSDDRFVSQAWAERLAGAMKLPVIRGLVQQDKTSEREVNEGM